MSTGTLVPWVKSQFFDNNGDPASGYQLFAYEAGTSTKLDTYSDVTLLTPNTNPIILDSAGRATIFLQAASYKFVLATDTDTDPPTSPIWTVDNVGSVPAAEVDTDVTGVAGENLLAGDAVYLSDGSGGQTAGRWYKTDASDGYSSSAAGMVGMVQAAISATVSGSIRLSGRITGLSGLTAGSVYYADATPGVLTLTPPVNARQIGMADTITSLIVGQGIPFATATTPGLVSATTQSIAGVKTFNNPPHYLVGGATADAVISGVVSSQSAASPIGNNTTDPETTLFTYTLPANSLVTDGQAFRVTGLISFAANGNTKVVKVYLGSTAATVVNAAINIVNGQGILYAHILRTGSGAQAISATMGVSAIGAAGSSYNGSAPAAEDVTGDLEIKVTGESSANNDVNMYNFMVEALGF